MEFYIPVGQNALATDSSAKNHSDFRSSVLLLPQPSLASVPQLSADLLVHTIPGMHLVGYLGIEDHVPAVSGLDIVENGNNEKEMVEEGISFSVQVYQTASKHLTIVLPRSPVIRSRRTHYLESLKAWIAEAQFSDVVVVSGIDAAMRGDAEYRNPSLFRHFIANPGSKSSRSRIVESLTYQTSPYVTQPSSLETEGESKPSKNVSGFASTSSTVLPLFPQSGLTRRLIECLSDSKAVLSVILVYVAEGDNRALAHMLADLLMEVLKSTLHPEQVGHPEEVEKANHPQQVTWKEPRSWKTGLMGAGLSRESGGQLYG